MSTDANLMLLKAARNTLALIDESMQVEDAEDMKREGTTVDYMEREALRAAIAKVEGEPTCKECGELPGHNDARVECYECGGSWCFDDPAWKDHTHD